MDKIDKLNKKIEEMQKKRLKHKKDQEYHQREKRKTNDPGKYSKHRNYEDFHLEKIAALDAEIQKLKLQVEDEQSLIKLKNYQNKLTAFYREFKELLINLLDLLEEDRWQEGLEQAEGLYNWYNEEKKKINEVDLKRIDGYINFKEVRSYINKVISNYARAEEVKFSYGDKIAKGFLLGHEKEKLISQGQLRSTIDIVDDILHPKKKSKSLLKKLGEKIVSKKEKTPVREPHRKGVVTTQSLQTIAETTRSKEIKPMPLTVKDHEKLALERAKKRLEESRGGN